ncbi:MAG TPA: hypothetical protein VFL72_05730 [Acidimicrobiia bacterium]|nr:hypothetical protein [Acidimicrobiia bacterium]
MRVIITVRELIDRDLWWKACEVLGTSEWAINEGQIDPADELKIESTEAFKIGLIKMNDDYTIKEEET